MGAHNAPLFCVISQSGVSNMKKKIETKSGFKCTIDDSVLDDMRIVEMIAGIEDNPLMLPTLISKFLTEEGKEKLYKHLETEDGRVPVMALETEMAEIITELGEKDIKK